MAKGVLRGILAGLSAAALGLAVASVVAPPAPRAVQVPAPELAVPTTQDTGMTKAEAFPGAAPVRAPQPDAPLIRPTAQADLAVMPVDAPPIRPLPPPAPQTPVVLTALSVAPVAKAPLPVRPARVDARLVTVPAAANHGTARLPAPTAPMAGPVEAVPRVSQPPVRPAVAVGSGPAAPVVPAVAADASPAAPVWSTPPQVASRSVANPALVVPGDLADAAPQPAESAPSRPPVRRAAEALLAQADAAAPVMKKAAPFAPAPVLRTEGAPQTEGTLPGTPASDAAEPSPAAASDTTVPAGSPPRVAFARPFDNPAQKPLLAIVLFDTGAPEIDRTALAALPFPVTFVLDPTQPESALAASIYRMGGQEVAMLANGIPQGATASDMEVTFAAHAAALPEAVAVVVPETGGFQDNRPVSTLVVPVVAGQGRGVLSWDRGLNAADQVARREGVPAATIFRRLDGKAEDAARIRQYLDRAAFKAAQEGRVVVSGETRAETVQALLAWAVEGRAATVALAPLTAALRTQ